MKKIIFAALVAAAVASPAMAQEAPASDHRSFTGFRVEAVVGYDNVGVPEIKNPSGALYGGGLGYDFALGGIVLGFEAEVDGSTAKLRTGGPDLTAGRDIYGGARIGTRLGSGLIYLKAGYTNARVEYAHSGQNENGVRAGLGYEMALSHHTFAKVEYRYSNYEHELSRNQAVAGVGFRF